MTFDLILVVVGSVVYLVAPESKVTELGRIAVFVGLFWLAGHGLALR